MFRQIGNSPYSVNEEGVVMNDNKGYVKMPTVNRDGYLVVGLWDKEKHKVVTHYVHKLVAECFLGDCDDKVVVFKDGNKLNCSVKNLDLSTAGEVINKNFESYNKEHNIIRLTNGINIFEFSGKLNAAKFIARNSGYSIGHCRKLLIAAVKAKASGSSKEIYGYKIVED